MLKSHVKSRVLCADIAEMQTSSFATAPLCSDMPAFGAANGAPAKDRSGIRF